MVKLIQHLDPQDKLPATIQENLPVCPICKEKTKWKIDHIFNMLWIPMEWITIQCTLCEAEWRYYIEKPIDMFIGGEIKRGIRFSKIINDNGIWILRKPDKDLRGEKFVNKKIKFSSWKQMARVSQLP